MKRGREGENEGERETERKRREYIHKYNLTKQIICRGEGRNKREKRNKMTYVMFTNCTYILVGSIIGTCGTILNAISILEYLMTCLKDLQTQNYIK